MKDNRTCFPARRRRVWWKRIVILGMTLVLTAGVAGFGLTDEKSLKAQMIKSKNTMTRNAIGRIEKLNPLRKNAYPELTGAVKKYYEELAEKADFVEHYRNIQVYTKIGRYRDTYVAFVTYGMKIKDIYTEVPGLGTLYIKLDQKSGKYKVQNDFPDDQTEAYVEAMAGQQDVQTLLAEIEKEYKEAVKSDALLQEALEDLKNAYEDSTGS